MKSYNLKVFCTVVVHVMLLSSALFSARTSVDVSTWIGNGAKSWKDLRDENIVRQSEDYSCGSASLATLLTAFYGDTVTEAEVLKAIDRKDAASFSDLQRVAESYGYNSAGVAAKLEHLYQLQVPVILFLKIRGFEHFTVFRGISLEQVWLADPSWGNKKISLVQFLKMWGTIDKSGMYGRMLLVMPKEGSNKKKNMAFVEAPKTGHGLLSNLTPLNYEDVAPHKNIFP